MNNSILQNKINEELKKLSPKTQEVINSVDWQASIDNISSKYKLADDERDSLKIETLLILIGLTDPERFEFEIENNVGVNKKESEEISNEILNRVLIPIADRMPKGEKILSSQNTTEKEEIRSSLKGSSNFISKNQIINQKARNLPKEIQEIISNGSWHNKLIEIGKKYALRVDQISELENETVLVLLALNSSDEYVNEIQKRLGVIGTKAQEIAKDAEEMIFKNIREELKQVYASGGAPDEEEIAPVEEKVLEKTGIDVEREPLDIGNIAPKTSDRNTIIAEVEKPSLTPNPPPAPPKSFVEQKMSAPFNMQEKGTDHSLNPLPEQKSVNKSDPYREVVE